MAVKEDIAQLFNYLGQDSSDRYHEFVQERGKEVAQEKWPILKAIQIAPNMIDVNRPANETGPFSSIGARSQSGENRRHEASALFASSKREPSFLSGLAKRTQVDRSNLPDLPKNQEQPSRPLWSFDKVKSPDDKPLDAQSINNNKLERRPAFFGKLHGGASPVSDAEHQPQVDHPKSGGLSAMFARLSQADTPAHPEEKPDLFGQYRQAEPEKTDFLFDKLLKS